MTNDKPFYSIECMISKETPDIYRVDILHNEYNDDGSIQPTHLDGHTAMEAWGKPSEEAWDILRKTDSVWETPISIEAAYYEESSEEDVREIYKTIRKTGVKPTNVEQAL